MSTWMLGALTFVIGVLVAAVVLRLVRRRFMPVASVVISAAATVGILIARWLFGR